MVSVSAQPSFDLQDRETVARPIDLVHLARQSLGDHELEMEILGMFDKMLETHMSALTSPTAQSDFAHSVHTIKGAAAGVGAKSVAQIAGQLETSFLADKKLDAELLSDLDLVVSETRTFISSLLQE